MVLTSGAEGRASASLFVDRQGAVGVGPWKCVGPPVDGAPTYEEEQGDMKMGGDGDVLALPEQFPGTPELASTWHVTE